MKVEFQEKIIELVADPELKVKFLGVVFESIGCNQELDKNIQIYGWNKAFFIAFLSSYVIEKAFSSVINILNKRSNLDISKGGDLRLYLTELQPNIELLANSHQAHPSH